MPNTNPLNNVENMLAVSPATNILVFSVNKEEIYGASFLNAGTMGYLHKDSDTDTIVAAIQTVLSGRVYISKEMQGLYFGKAAKNKADSNNPYAVLSPKEMEVLHFLNDDNTMMQVSRLMNLAPSTVTTHKTHILQKLQMKNIFELKEFLALNPLHK